MSTEHIEQSVIEKLRALPPDRKLEVLDFVESLARKVACQEPRRILKGALADVNIDVTEEQIAEARGEMWSKFPREEPK